MPNSLNKTIKKKLKIPLIFLVSFFLLLQLLGLTLDSSYFGVDWYSKKPMDYSSQSILTNDFVIKKQEYGLFPRSESIVIALNPSANTVFVANRSEPIINEYSISDLNKTKKVLRSTKFPILNSKTQIYDLSFYKGNLFASIGKIGSNKCLEYSIIEFENIESKGFETVNTIFTYKTDCLQSEDGPNNLFSGRIIVDDNFIFLSTGLIITDILKNLYVPERMSGLPSTFSAAESKFPIFGKILKINTSTGKYSIYSSGHRTPQGLAFFKIGNSKLVVGSEHGPRGGDELNLITEGKDYGWPYVSFGKPYEQKSELGLGSFNAQYGSHDKFQEPFYYFTASVGISQITQLGFDVVNSNWKSPDLLVTSLKDKALYHTKLKLNGEVLTVSSIERISIERRIRDIETMNNEIFLGTDEGSLIILKPTGEQSDQIVGIYPPMPADTLLYKMTHVIQKIIKKLNS